MGAIDEIQKCFELRGDSEYGGESVTQLEHALQCAWLAEQESVEDHLVVAALLHDVGHLLHDLPDDAPDQGIDDCHENLGYRYLTEHFDNSICEPVRLHVAAKRYLCTIDSDYVSTLSEPSRISLALQGGLMSVEEKTAFEAHEHWRSALLLRKWDDTAKIDDLVTPELSHYLAIVSRWIATTAPTQRRPT